MHAPNNTHSPMRRLLRESDLPFAAPFFTLGKMRVYTDPAPEPAPTPDPEPSPEPTPLSADTPIPEALRTALNIGDTTTLGGLAKRFTDAQAQILNPKAPDAYDMTRAKELMGDNPDTSDLEEVAKGLGLNQKRFDKMLELVQKGTKADAEKWKTDVQKALGEGVKFEELENQFRTLSGKSDVTLTNVHPELLSGMKSVLDRAIASGLKPPTTGDPSPTPTYDSRFTMKIGEQPFGVSMEGSADERAKSLSAFYNAKVEVTGKDGTKKEVLVREHDQGTWRRVYYDAMSEHSAKSARGE